VSATPWHVLGAGAVGCLFSAALARSGRPVTLVLRSAPATETVPVIVERDGLARELRLAATGAGDGGPIRQLLVTTKAYDVATAVASVSHRLDEKSIVLVLANGMGFEDELSGRLPAMDLYFGITTEGVTRTGPRRIRHAGLGATGVGQPGRTLAPPWFEAWADAVPRCHWDPAIGKARWMKLAVNCAINPLTAIHRCANGELRRDPALAVEVEGLCEEIEAVGAAAGFAGSPGAVRQSVARVIAETADNRSSMLQDVLAGRRTEIDYITGYLLTVARRCYVSTPRNESLYRQVRQLVP